MSDAASGIPRFVADLDGPLTVGLIVRVGESDETLPIHGISHLCEHLLLSTAERRGTWNGFVDATTTNFVVTGDDQEVVDFYARLNQTILDPPYDRIATESRILKTEAANRGGRGVLALALAHRLGPCNYGIRTYRESMFDAPNPQLVHHWLTTHYTRGNTAIWSNRPLPPNFSFDLPDGPRVPVVAPTWLDETYPAFVTERMSSIVCTVLGHWSTELLMALTALRERLFTTLRIERGLSYDVGLEIESIGGRLLHAAIHADGLAENLVQVRDIMQAEVDRACWDGVDQAILDRMLVDTERSDADDKRPGTAAERARCHLLDVPFTTHELLVDATRAMTPASVAASIAGVAPTALWIVPNSVSAGSHRMTRLRPWSRSRVSGAPIPIPKRESDSTSRKLVIDDTGVSILHGNEEFPITVAYRDVAAVFAFTNGDRTLVGNDGFVLTIEANRWQDPAPMIAYIDRFIPPHAFVVIHRDP